mmetsp:Transcript_13587/g.20576  ORF Transcript_13587/g.20576 Transcript_13587/m.20576 type:complete len:732 (-) Transcript_13587:52-2247(-)
MTGNKRESNVSQNTEDTDEYAFDRMYNKRKPESSFSPTIPLPKNGTGLPMQIPGPHHIHSLPSEPEETYQITDTLVARMVLHDSQRMANPHTLLNRVVYDCIDPSPMHYKQSSMSKRNRKSTLGPALKPYYIPMSKDDTTLVFESRFESGNLRRAIQVYEFEYDLILKFDVNTRGHTQWFYFSVDNAKKGKTYKFNIINLLKSDSLYNYGMRPLIYSEKDAKEKSKGWYRGGTDICYYQNSIKRKSGYFYTFTFSYKFENDHDKYYFAYCYPYTYTQLQHYLATLEHDPVRRKLFRRRTLCQTLAGNNVDLLTITSFSCDPQALQNRKGVVVSSRVHPGESNGSYMMKGIIDYLTGPSVDAKILRDNFVFKIVPMLNPDGVINGNYRCSLAGVDLNRRWSDPSIKLHPTVYYTKEMIRKFKGDRHIVLFCDLHGHSRKKNIFMYGCNRVGRQRLSTRIFPRILWKIAQYFSYQDCSFGISKSKESCGRVVVFRELGIHNSYTMEASFCGASFGRLNSRHFSTKHLEQMGHFFCEAILDYCDPDQTRVDEVTRELELLYPSESIQGATTNPNAFQLTGDNDSIGSDDEASDSASVRKKKKSSKGSKSKSSSKKSSKKDKKKKEKSSSRRSSKMERSRPPSVTKKNAMKTKSKGGQKMNKKSFSREGSSLSHSTSAHTAAQYVSKKSRLLMRDSKKRSDSRTQSSQSKRRSEMEGGGGDGPIRTGSSRSKRHR